MNASYDVVLVADQETAQEYKKYAGRVPGFVTAKSDEQAQRKAQEWLDRGNDRADSFGRNGLKVKAVKRPKNY